MRINGLTDEDLVNYKLPSMFIATSFCSFKCDRESGESCCQNSSLAMAKPKFISDDELIQRYIDNPISQAIVFGGLEPFDQYQELFNFIFLFRLEYERPDPIVIYTGYNRDEIEGEIAMLSQFQNVIVKFGRFVPNRDSRFDDVLGIKLASDNQYAEVL